MRDLDIDWMPTWEPSISPYICERGVGLHARPAEAPMHSGGLKRADMSREVGAGVPKERSEGLEYITKELAMDRGVWKLAIHVQEP